MIDHCRAVVSHEHGWAIEPKQPGPAPPIAFCAVSGPDGEMNLLPWAHSL